VARFLIDAQLPPALARRLAELGHIAEHVMDIGPGDAPDGDLWRYALEHGAVIVTKDEDFSDWVAVRTPSPVVVWLRKGNTSRAALLAWFEPLIPQVARAITSGQQLIELR
jgi:predicted nuclease of predicted toxin-antitoxin system